MSDSRQLRTSSPLADIRHLQQFSDNMKSLLENPVFSDVTLIVENSRFAVHRIVLASQSDYFRALFFGGLQESLPETREVELREIRSCPFAALLKYMYSGCIDLSELKEDDILELLCISHQYTVPNLVKAIYDYLKSAISLNNVCAIFDVALLFSHDSLVNACQQFLDANAENVINTEGFTALSDTALQEIVSRSSFCAAEVDIFKAICRWIDTNTTSNSNKIVSAVRLPLMTQDQLLDVVRPTGLVSPDAILDAIEMQRRRGYCGPPKHLQHRGILCPDENVATPAHRAHVIRGEIRDALLDGNVDNYDLDRGFSRHPIDDNNGQGIVVKLGRPSIINSIRMLLWDKDQRSYSYYVEVSIDDDTYTRIIDHTQYLCRSWQALRFEPVVARYIRVVGTHNTVNRVFHLVAFECSYTTAPPVQLDNGLIVPTENVATVHNYAQVIEGVSRVRNALINGDFVNYDWDSGYTCHQLNSGCILVQLAKPFIMDSLRMLLWDCDDRRYSYYIETSCDGQNYELLADCRQHLCRSWQLLIFPKRPVVFIKIVGTHNTANEVFHTVHLETPAVLSSPDLISVRENYRKGILPTASSSSVESSESDGLGKALLVQQNDLSLSKSIISFVPTGGTALSTPSTSTSNSVPNNLSTVQQQVPSTRRSLSNSTVSAALAVAEGFPAGGILLFRSIRHDPLASAHRLAMPAQAVDDGNNNNDQQAPPPMLLRHHPQILATDGQVEPANNDGEIGRALGGVGPHEYPQEEQNDISASRTDQPRAQDSFSSNSV